MDMTILAYIYLFLITSTALFILTAVVVEKHVSEDSKFMKWWRKHVISPAPDDIDI